MTSEATHFGPDDVEGKANAAVGIELATQRFELGEAVGEQEAQLKASILGQAVIGQERVNTRGQAVGVFCAFTDVAPLESTTFIKELAHLKRATAIEMPIKQRIQLPYGSIVHQRFGHANSP